MSHSELAYVNAAIFAGKPLRFLALDQIIFSLPVPIGAVVRMKAVTVTSTRPKTKEELSNGLEFTSAGNAKVHVVVTAQIQDLAKGVSRRGRGERKGTDHLISSQSRETTNSFFFSFASENREPLPKLVVPKTYQEAMAYIEGARRLEVGGALRRHYKSS
jgi:acyl-coenzyme A thioesterase 9